VSGAGAADTTGTMMEGAVVDALSVVETELEWALVEAR